MAKRIINQTHRQTTRVDTKNQPTRFYSVKQEKTVAEKFNGNRTKNSGATAFDKGDVNLDNILVECKTKTTNSKSITIQKEWIEKNKQEALFMGKPYSVIAFNFGPNENNHYIIDEELFELLINKIGDSNGK